MIFFDMCFVFDGNILIGGEWWCGCGVFYMSIYLVD